MLMPAPSSWSCASAGAGWSSAQGEVASSLFFLLCDLRQPPILNFSECFLLLLREGGRGRAARLGTVQPGIGAHHAEIP